jgi:tubulin-like protein CetZ
MRIIAIGIGGAGCRIVNSLYAIDRRSSKVACVQALAIDVDEETMKHLSALPENSRMCFSAFEPEFPNSPHTERQRAPIDINEIISRIQNLEYAENDAIFFCCGLGGSMVDVAPHIIAGLRSSVVEPIFGLVTLPCLAEGERISGKAADDIEMLSSLLDGIIVFDNETWHKKIKTQRANLPKKERGFAEKIGLIKSDNSLPPGQKTYHNLNEVIVRRIGLMLRAGEFKADGGIDLAEVVLDSGEVLNTMKGMGFITLGYAVEKLPHDPLRFLSWLKPAGLNDEEEKKRASRIVELAKQAIYHEISTPCDLTSAHKALVLIAGPSHELSMKGFMTVRKWIDRSIAGLETRSGDYPVMNTKNVAIIVMLSGLENIPRITELKEIRAQSKPKKPADAEDSSDGLPKKELIPVRDDMITLPVRRARADDTGRCTHERERQEESSGPAPEPEPVPQAGLMDEPEEQAPPVAVDAPRPARPPRPVVSVPEPVSEPESRQLPDAPVPSRRRVIVAHDVEKENTHRYPAHSLPAHGNLRTGTIKGIFDRSVPETPAREADEEVPRTQETERQRIERELRRQRSMAMGGYSRKTPQQAGKSHDTVEEKQILHRNVHQDQKGGEDTTPDQGREHATATGEKRTVIIGKRKVAPMPQDPEIYPPSEKTGPAYPDEPDVDGMSVEIRDRVFQAKDEIFSGKGVRKPPVPPARDSTLLHTELRSKKKSMEKGSSGTEDTPPGMDSLHIKKRARPDKDF